MRFSITFAKVLQDVLRRLDKSNKSILQCSQRSIMVPK